VKVRKLAGAIAPVPENTRKKFEGRDRLRPLKKNSFFVENNTILFTSNYKIMPHMLSNYI
jgi:hypothetical protein